MFSNLLLFFNNPVKVVFKDCLSWLWIIFKTQLFIINLLNFFKEFYLISYTWSSLWLLDIMYKYTAYTYVQNNKTKMITTKINKEQYYQFCLFFWKLCTSNKLVLVQYESSTRKHSFCFDQNNWLTRLTSECNKKQLMYFTLFCKKTWQGAFFVWWQYRLYCSTIT